MNTPLYESDVLHGIVDSQSVLVADLETGEILYASRLADRMFAYPVIGELVGKNVDDLVPDEAKGRHKDHRAVYLASPGPRLMGERMTLRGRKANGVLFPVEVELVPRLISNRRCVVATIFDMSIRHPPEIVAAATAAADQAYHQEIEKLEKR